VALLDRSHQRSEDHFIISHICIVSRHCNIVIISLVCILPTLPGIHLFTNVKNDKITPLTYICIIPDTSTALISPPKCPLLLCFTSPEAASCARIFSVPVRLENCSAAADVEQSAGGLARQARPSPSQASPAAGRPKPGLWPGSWSHTASHLTRSRLETISLMLACFRRAVCPWRWATPSRKSWPSVTTGRATCDEDGVAAVLEEMLRRVCE